MWCHIRLEVKILVVLQESYSPEGLVFLEIQVILHLQVPDMWWVHSDVRILLILHLQVPVVSEGYLSSGISGVEVSPSSSSTRRDYLSSGISDTLTLPISIHTRGCCSFT